MPASADGDGGLPLSDITDPGLAEAGRARIEWAQRGMPVLRLIAGRFAAQRPFAGLTIAACLHVTAETAGLVNALRAGGARSLPGRLQPAVHPGRRRGGARRRRCGGRVRPGRGGPARLRRAHPPGARRRRPGGPDLVIDDGGDLVNTLHEQRPDLLAAVRGGCESTATGVIRLRRMADEGALAFPMVAADATTTKRMFDNTCGTGQSVIDGVLRATNTLLA